MAVGYRLIGSNGTICDGVVSVQINVTKASSQSPNVDPSPSGKSSSNDTSSGGTNEPSADDSTVGTDSKLERPLKESLVVALPNTGAGPRTSSYDATSWLSLVAFAMVIAGCAAAFVRRRQKE